MLTVILLGFKEQDLTFLKKNSDVLINFSCEVLLSTPVMTSEIENTLQELNFTWIETSQRFRGERIAEAVKQAANEKILVIHPRSYIKSEAVDYLISENWKGWGGLTHQFDRDHYLLKFTSWYSNYIRTKRGVLYLDHCLYFYKSDFLKILPLPQVEIFEDTIISSRLNKRMGPPRILNFLSVTSAIRFVEGGVWRHAVKNQILKLKYLLNFDLNSMNKEYEEKTRLNTK